MAPGGGFSCGVSLIARGLFLVRHLAYLLSVGVRSRGREEWPSMCLYLGASYAGYTWRAGFCCFSSLHLIMTKARCSHSLLSFG